MREPGWEETSAWGRRRGRVVKWQEPRGSQSFRSFQLKHLTYRQVKMGETEAGIHIPPSSCSGYSCDVWSCGSDNHGANANALRVVKKEVRVPDGMLGS